MVSERSNETDSEGNVVQSGICSNSGGVQFRIGRAGGYKAELGAWVDENEPE